MIQNITKHIPLTTIIISYFFICGGLYIIGFWTTFDLDVSNLVTLGDIPKSFVLPFTLTNGYFLFNFISNLITTRYSNRDKKPEKPVKEKSLFMTIITDPTMIFLFASIIIFIFYKPYGRWFWGLMTFTFASFLTYRLYKSSIFSFIQNHNLRLYAAYFIGFFPISSFAAGKIFSLNIYQNYQYKMVSKITVSNQTIKNDSLVNSKLLGFLGDKLILSSFDNKKIIVLNHSTVDELELIDKKKE